MNSTSSPPSAARIGPGTAHQDRIAAGLAALEHQAAAARATLPHFALIERTRAAWLPALDVATDAGDIEQLAQLAAEAPTEFAAGLASGRVAGLQEI